MKKRKLSVLSEEDIARIKELSVDLVNIPQEQAIANKDILEKYLADYDFSEQDDLYARVMFELGVYYGHNEYVQEAASIFEQMIDFGKRKNLPHTVLRSRSNLAITRAQQGHFQEAMEVWIEVLQDDPSPQTKLTMLNNLSVGYGFTGQYSKGVEYCFKTLEMADQLNLPEEMINPYENLGSHYTAMGLHEKALEALLKNLELADKYGKIRRYAECCSSISLNYAALNNYEQALHYAYRALVLKFKYASELDSANAINNIGSIYMNSGKIDEALIYFERAMQIFEKGFDKAGSANCKMNIAEISRQQGDLPKALKYLQEAYAALTELDAKLIISRCLQLLRDVNKEMGNFEEALKYAILFSEGLGNSMEEISKNTVSITEADYYKKKIETQAKLYLKQNTELKQRNRIIKHKSKELLVSNRALSETNELLNRMVSIVSHDIRAPLGNIVQALGLVNDGVLEPEDQTELLQELQISSAEALGLLNEMLDWIKFNRQHKDQTISIVRQDIVPGIKNIINFYMPLARQKKISLSFQADKSSVLASVDNDLLKVMLRNLLNNALKFTQPGGRIDLSTYESDGFVCISISDDGVGMNSSQVDKLLSGKASSQSGTANETGFGMGFRLCLDSIQRMQGKINIISEPGKGTTIELFLKP